MSKAKQEADILEPISEELQPTIDFADAYKRALADQENTRRRFEEEKRQFIKYAQESLIADLLPVVDNFYRATEHVPDEQKNSPWLTGILHIQKQLLDILEAQGVREIPVKAGDPFNPATQEAIGTVIDESVPEDHLIEVKNRGYMLQERVLRPAHVIVSTRN